MYFKCGKIGHMEEECDLFSIVNADNTLLNPKDYQVMNKTLNNTMSSSSMTRPMAHGWW